VELLRCSVTCVAAAVLFAADPSQVAFEKAVAALAGRDYAAAEHGFQTVLRTKPNHVGALGNLGVVYSRTHRYAKAIEVYQRALRLGPGDAGLLLNLGLAYSKQEQYDKALPLFSEIVAADPGNRQARELMATCQIYAGHPEAAAPQLELLRVGGTSEAGVLYLLGIAYTRLKQPEKAQAAFSEMMNVASPALASFLMGKALYDVGRFEEAAEAFQKTLVTDAGLQGAHLGLGKVYVSLRRNEEAENELRLALQQDSADPETLYFLGALLALNGRPSEAATYLETARRLIPDAWGVSYYLGRIRLQEHKAAQAVPLLERAAKLNPAQPAVYYQLARALKLAGRDAESRQALLKVKELKAGELQEEVQVLSRSRP
jgi:tetratricopeptide (TPR) repeat protein